MDSDDEDPLPTIPIGNQAVLSQQNMQAMFGPMQAAGNKEADETETDVEMSSRHLSGFSRKSSMASAFSSDRNPDHYFFQNANQNIVNANNSAQIAVTLRGPPLPSNPFQRVPCYFHISSKNPLAMIYLPAENYNASVWTRRGVCLLCRPDVGR